MAWETHRALTSCFCSAHLCVPGAEGLDGTAQHDDLARDGGVHHDFIKTAGGRPAVLDIVEAQVEAHRLRQQRQQRPLLQLVVQDRCVALAPVTHPTSALTIQAHTGDGISEFCLEMVAWIQHHAECDRAAQGFNGPPTKVPRDLSQALC